ncbi:nucleotidyltransferase family protein [Streptomyces varsoviensis]|uniref:nucleotidyltransferase family protein n=1 Tax=Streptomyces varsoviensis TaxID=67373 RepID=UPI0033D1362A
MARTTEDERAPVAGLLLAAGGGRRLGGRPKALLEYRGTPLVERAARELLAGGCASVRVVLGAAAERVRARTDLAALTGHEPLVNPDWERGMGSSLRVGLGSLTGSGASAALVMLVDQPGMGAEAVARVLAAHRAGADLVAASYEGRRGHPVLFGAARWPEVAASATGDRGARAYLQAHAGEITLVECADVASPDDIDTPEDLALLE